MQLRTGRTYEQAIRFLDDMTQGGMNDTNNSIPRIGSPSFEQMMPAAVLRYERWTEIAQRQLRELFVAHPIIDRAPGLAASPASCSRILD